MASNDRKKMQAVICTKYGPPKVLKLVEVDRPTPKANEVLIRNYGTSINTVDMLHRGGKAPKVAFFGIKTIVGLGLRLSFGGLRKPKQKIPGQYWARGLVWIWRWPSKPVIRGSNPRESAHGLDHHQRTHRGCS